MRNTLVKDYLQPIRVVAKSENIENAEVLLVNQEKQTFFNVPKTLDCKGKGYIILDFGKELHGGVRLITSYYDAGCASPKIRLRFGESVGETCAESAKKERQMTMLLVILRLYCQLLQIKNTVRRDFVFCVSTFCRKKRNTV